MKTQRMSWYIGVSLALSLLIFSAFTAARLNEKIKGNGNIKQEDRQGGPFKSVSSSGAYNIYIQQGNQHDIKVEADDNILPYIVTEVNGNELNIRTKRGYDIRPSKSINIYITMDEVEKLTSSGSGNFSGKGKLKGNNVSFEFSGSTNVTLDLDATKLDVDVSGSSRLNLKGAITQTDYDISGSGHVEALDLQSDDVDIDISGSGRLDVNAQKKLKVSVSGSGHVRYKGSPSINQSSSGMAKVTKVE